MRKTLSCHFISFRFISFSPSENFWKASARVNCFLFFAIPSKFPSLPMTLIENNFCLLFSAESVAKQFQLKSLFLR